MNVTPKFIIFALASAAFVMTGGLLFGDICAVLLFVFVNLVLGSLIIIDFVSTPAPGELTVTREAEEKLSLNGTHIVTLYVKNNSKKRLAVEVRDDIPEFFESSPVSGEAVVSPGFRRAFVYTLKPLKRGEFTFPCINYRYRGIYGFILRYGKNKTPVTYRVYPNMQDISRYNLAALSKNIFVSGVKKIRTSSGEGEFDSLRPYREGDSFKSINWNATARLSELIVNTYVPERNQYIYVLIDSSRVMNGTYNNIKMLDYSINAAFLLADYCIKGGDNIGMLAFDSEVRRTLKAGKGNAQFSLLADKLYNVEENENSADYSLAFKTFAEMQHRRALVFVFTELFNCEEAERLAGAVREHLSGHLVCAITTINPKINAAAKESEDPYLKASAVKFINDRKAAAAIMAGAGIRNVETEPDRLSLAAVSEYLNVKRQGLL